MNLSKFVVSILFVGLFACQEAPRTTYAISGEAKDVYDGLRVYLNNTDLRSKLIATDTAIVFNGKFTFKGSVNEPGLKYLTIQSVKGRLPILIENSAISVKINKEKINDSEIMGSSSHSDLRTYYNEIRRINDSITILNSRFKDAKSNNDQEEINSLKIKADALTLESKNYAFEFVNNHRSSFASLIVLKPLLRGRQVDLPRVIATFQGLDKNLVSSEKGQEIQQIIEASKLQLEKEKSTDIGKKAPEFSASTPDGEQLALSDVYSKGKITIVDFWAAWCGPCRRENPNIVKIYNKYHDKGLEILGVSLDGNRNQKDPKGAWIKAIEDDQLTWNHVSNLKYFGPIASLYNVRAIPAMFILDEEGKIIAKNLRGKALENKVAELLGS